MYNFVVQPLLLGLGLFAITSLIASTAIANAKVDRIAIASTAIDSTAIDSIATDSAEGRAGVPGRRRGGGTR